MPAARKGAADSSDARSAKPPRGSRSVPVRSAVPAIVPRRPRSGAATPAMASGSESMASDRSSPPPVSGTVPRTVAATP